MSHNTSKIRKFTSNMHNEHGYECVVIILNDELSTFNIKFYSDLPKKNVRNISGSGTFIKDSYYYLMNLTEIIVDEKKYDITDESKITNTIQLIILPSTHKISWSNAPPTHGHITWTESNIHRYNAITVSHIHDISHIILNNEVIASINEMFDVLNDGKLLEELINIKK